MPKQNTIIILVLLFAFFGLIMNLLPNLPTYITNNNLMVNMVVILMFFSLITGFVWVLKNERS
jgi:hypothetical protein